MYDLLLVLMVSVVVHILDDSVRDHGIRISYLMSHLLIRLKCLFLHNTRAINEAVSEEPQMPILTP